MSERLNTHETVADFIEHRMQELAVKQMASRTNSSLTNVTLRLPKGEVAAIDKVAGFLDMNRQHFLFELIGAGMEQTMFKLAGTLTGKEKKAFIDSVYALWTAHDVELEGQKDE